MSFGWSAGDIVATVNILVKVGEALKESGGAATDYRETVAFLNSVTKTLSALQNVIQNNSSLACEADLIEQGNHLKAAIGEFEKKIEKYDNSLGVGSKRPKVRRIPREIQFGLSNQVKELRTAISQPQLVLDILINLQTLTSLLDISRTTSISEEKLKSLTESVFQLMPALNTSVGNLGQVIKLGVQDFKATRRTSDLTIREHMNDLKSHMRELERIQRSIADRNQEDNRALARWQTELQQSIQALHASEQAQLELLLSKKRDDQHLKSSSSTIDPFQLPFNGIEFISSVIASGIGAMIALFFHSARNSSSQACSNSAPYRGAPSTTKLCGECDKTWQCCECGDGLHNAAYPYCPVCGHVLCGDCERDLSKRILGITKEDVEP